MNETAFAFEDKYPVVKNHTLIAPTKHASSFFDLGSYEKNACLILVEEIRKKILEIDKTVTGFNVGFNDGLDAGQTVFHCHIHVIPRRKGDVENPSGGIRNIIPNKGTYQ
jgi:diadenosine tetraphosphate (Ap4A) HIT family hydrolase